MLQKLYKLGLCVPQNRYPENPLGLNDRYAESHIAFLCFRRVDGVWTFEDVAIENFDQDRIRSYLFKTKGANSVSEFPTLDIYKREDLLVDGAVDFATSKQGRKLNRILAGYQNEIAQLAPVLANQPDIGGALWQKLLDLDLKRFALSFKLDGLYLGDSPYLFDLIGTMESATYNADYFTHKGKTYEGLNQACSFTHRQAPRVWGYAAPESLKFYAVKTEFAPIAGGFDARFAWRNFPVSPAATKVLERGLQFLDEKLRFNFCGYTYYLLPERVLPGEDPDYLDLIEGFGKFGLSREAAQGANAEIDLVEMLAEQNNAANYSLFFFERNNAEFKILASIDEVFPSAMRRLFQTKRALETDPIFRDRPGPSGPYNLIFDFSIVKHFFPDSAKEGRFRNGFLNLLRSIFMAKPIDPAFLLFHIMTRIRHEFRNASRGLGSVELSTRRAFMLWKLLNNLGLLKNQKPPSRPVNEEIMSNPYETLFARHPDFFDSAIKKAVFLEGVLSQKLLAIQWRDKHATPFRDRLNGLKLDERVIKRLLPEIIEKLEQYGKNYYHELEHLIAGLFLEAQFNLSRDEYAFYFVLGMSLARDFKFAGESPTIEEEDDTDE